MLPSSGTEIEAKNTFFLQHTTLNCKGKLVSIENPLIMGVLNITPDSFYERSRFCNLSDALDHVSFMIDNGASIIDVGAVSTRPGSKTAGEKDEINRLLPVLRGIMKKHPDAVISIDTFRAGVAEASVAEGASMINDISGGTMDERMFETIAGLNVPYVLMHLKGTPSTMQENPEYDDVTKEVIIWLAERVQQLRKLGVNDIIIDPGFGFGKTTEHNYTMMREMEYFSILQLPLLVGISRKSMIYKPLNINPDDSLTGSTALHFHALSKGANILRVHDVKEARQTIEIYRMVYGRQQYV